MTKETIFDHSTDRIYEHDGDNDNEYIPSRALPMAINSTGHVLLPDNSKVITNSKQFRGVVESLDLTLPEVIEFPDSDYVLDASVRDNLPILKERLDREISYQVNPYINGPELQEWTEELNNDGYNIRIGMEPRVYLEDVTSLQHRSGWSRNVNEPDKASFPETCGINYPVSYYGRGLSEIKRAFELTMERSDSDSSYFKPVCSAGGFSLRKIKNLIELEDHYKILKAQGALELFGEEIPVEMQATIMHPGEFTSFQYANGEITTPGGVTIQIIENNQWVGNEFNTSKTHLYADGAGITFKRFMNGLVQRESREKTLQRHGGFDQINGEYTIEHNGGRLLGADPASKLAREFNVDQQPFMIIKTSEPDADLSTLWSMLRANKIAFDQNSKEGVFPLMWMPGSGMIFTTANDEQKMRQMTDFALDSIHRNGYAKK